MPIVRDPACGRIRLAAVVTFLVSEGWKVSRTADGRIALYKAGMPPIFNGACCDVDPDMPSNWRDRLAYTSSRKETPDG